MKKLLIVILFLFLATFIYSHYLFPTYTNSNQYQQEVEHYINGITA